MRASSIVNDEKSKQKSNSSSQMLCEKEGVSEVKSDLKRDKEEKKNKGVEDELTVAFGNNGEMEFEIQKQVVEEKKSKDDNDQADLSSVQQQQQQQQENDEDHTQASKTNHERKKNIANETQKCEAEHTKKDQSKKRKISLVLNSSDDTLPNKSNKKVRFSNSNTDKVNAIAEEENMVRGKWFTREEDGIVKAAVMKYIEEHKLGDEGVDMVLNSKKHPKLRDCWKEIGSSIPYRPRTSVYWRAQVLFKTDENQKWTQEEKDKILKYQELHGNRWKALADELGKHRWHVKDIWRQMKLRNPNKGRWSQEEYQKLFDLVNADLQLKVSEEKKSKHGMLRDNIRWSAISDELSTRNHSNCCRKWYKQLTSAMVVKGVWADSDDYRLVGALYSLDASCTEDVDWDSIIETRSGDVCRRRWNQMVRHIGDNGKKSFAEQVEVLAERYCPHLLEARQTWDDKPRVP